MSEPFGLDLLSERDRREAEALLADLFASGPSPDEEEKAVAEEQAKEPERQKSLADIAGTFGPTAEDLERAGEVAGKVAKAAPKVAADVAFGTLTGAGSVRRALMDEVANAVLTANDLGAMVADQFGIPHGPDTPTPNIPGAQAMRDELGRVFQDLEARLATEESTVTGQVIRDMAGFLTIFLPVAGQVGKIGFIQKAIQAGGKTGAAARIGKDVTASAVTFFANADVSKHKLLDTVETASPDAREAVERLIDDPTDARLALRAREAMLGAGFGLLAYTGVEAAKAIGRIAKVKIATRRASPALSAALDQTDDAATRVVQGMPDDVLVRKVTPDPDLAARRLVEAEQQILAKFPDLTPDEVTRQASLRTLRFQANFDRISDEQDIVKLVKDTARLMADEIQTARRGVRSDELVRREAAELGYGVKEVLSRRAGRPISDSEVLAFGSVWNSMAETVRDLAARAVNGSTVDLWRYRKGMAVLHAIQQQVFGSAAEAGRSLRAHRLIVEGSRERMLAIKSIMQEAGGEAYIRKTARAFIDAMDGNLTQAQLQRIVQGGVLQRGWNMFKEMVASSYLWFPRTHLVNMTGNSINLGLSVAERRLGANVGAAIGSNVIAPGEAQALRLGLREGLTTAMRMTAYRMQQSEGRRLGALMRLGGKVGQKALRVDSDDLAKAAAEADDILTSIRGTKYEIRPGAISKEAFGRFRESGIARATDAFGRFTRKTFDGLQAEDDIFKVVAWRGEIKAQAYRMAVHEGKRKGWNAGQVAQRMADIIENPPEPIRLAAADFAKWATFVDELGEMGRALMVIRDHSPLFPLIPYLKTPTRLLIRGSQISPVAPLTRTFWKNIRSGGAQAELALSSLAIGSATSALVADLAYEGLIQGSLPADPGERRLALRLGERGDSIVLGDKATVGFGRLDPIALPIAATATLVQTFQEREMSDEQMETWMDLFIANTLAMSQSVLNKTWFMNMSRLVEAISYPESRLTGFVRSMAQMMVPVSSLGRLAVEATDDELPQVLTATDAVVALLPGFEKSLPRMRTLWGDVVTRDLRLLNIVSPLPVRGVKRYPIDEEMRKQDMAPRDIGIKSFWSGVVTPIVVDFRDYPNVYETYVRLSGNDLKINGAGAREYLDAMVQGKNAEGEVYRRFPDDTDRRTIKKDMIERVITRYRRQAQIAIESDPEGRFRSEEFQRFRLHLATERQLNLQETLEGVRMIQ